MMVAHTLCTSLNQVLPGSYIPLFLFLPVVLIEYHADQQR